MSCVEDVEVGEYEWEGKSESKACRKWVSDIMFTSPWAGDISKLFIVQPVRRKAEWKKWKTTFMGRNRQIKQSPRVCMSQRLAFNFSSLQTKAWRTFLLTGLNFEVAKKSEEFNGKRKKKLLHKNPSLKAPFHINRFKLNAKGVESFKSYRSQT